MFLPATIDLGQSEKYILSIRIKPDSFMFSIHEPGGRNYCLREVSFSADLLLLENIQRTIFDLNFLTQQFMKTNVIFVSSEYDLIPSAYYEHKDRSLIHNMVHDKKMEHILSQPDDKQVSTTLFSIDSHIFEFLSRSLFNPIFYNHASLLISLFGNKNRAISLISKMYINFHDDFLDIICFSNSKLIHCLTYEGENVQNQIYYILKLWEKCNFDQLKDQLHVAGKPGGEILPTLRKYIKNIESVNTPSEVYLWHEEALKAPLDLLTLAL